MNATNDSDDLLARTIAKLTKIKSLDDFGSVASPKSVWGRASEALNSSYSFDSALELKTRVLLSSDIQALIEKYQNESVSTVSLFNEALYVESP